MSVYRKHAHGGPSMLAARMMRVRVFYSFVYPKLIFARFALIAHKDFQSIVFPVAKMGKVEHDRTCQMSAGVIDNLLKVAGEPNRRR